MLETNVLEQLKFEMILSSMNEETFESCQKLVQKEVRNRRLADFEKQNMSEFDIACEEAEWHNEFDLILPYVLAYRERENFYMPKKEESQGSNSEAGLENQTHVTLFYTDLSSDDEVLYRVILDNCQDDIYLMKQDFFFDVDSHMKHVKEKQKSQNQKEIDRIQNSINRLKEQQQQLKRFAS